jgi:hypothetical protein
MSIFKEQRCTPSKYQNWRSVLAAVTGGPWLR